MRKRWIAPQGIAAEACGGYDLVLNSGALALGLEGGFLIHPPDSLCVSAVKKSADEKENFVFR